jgi:hypothetical protein
MDPKPVNRDASGLELAQQAFTTEEQLMSIHEIEAEALKLPDEERARLAERLLASLGRKAPIAKDDPIFRIGTSPIDDDDLTDGSVEHDRYIYRQPHG